VTTTPTTESVVLLDEDGRAVGTMDKRAVHHRETPLHLAFSCYVFDASGALLVTQRALDKRTFPGVWTNSCCGHPAPGEPLADAVRRRVLQELGLRLGEVRLLLPAFRYRVAAADGTVENEMCPVYVATAAGPVRPEPDEVAATVWEPWPQFRAAVLDDTRVVSPWCRDQMALLPADPLSAPARPDVELPPAARPAPRRSHGARG
jgi:isopentenyl-diphosphate delta-isomerase